MNAQYSSITYAERLTEAGIDASIGTVGDSCDNALAETISACTGTAVVPPVEPEQAYYAHHRAQLPAEIPHQ